MNVKIKIYDFELESMLDKLHCWSNQYDWGGVSGHPSIQIELVVEKDLDNKEEKYIGDRFAESAETVNSDEIINRIRNTYAGPKLSDFVKGSK